MEPWVLNLVKISVKVTFKTRSTLNNFQKIKSAGNKQRKMIFTTLIRKLTWQRGIHQAFQRAGGAGSGGNPGFLHAGLLLSPHPGMLVFRVSGKVGEMMVE